jgi:hypothetical protein
MPYHKRDTLRVTLQSFIDLYGTRNDYEVIIVESKGTLDNLDEHSKLLHIIKDFNEKINIQYLINSNTGYSCCYGYNTAFKYATGEFIIITNPECYHTIDILAGLDKLFQDNKNYYIVCACEAVTPDNKHFVWYQHSRHNNRMLHFCSAISRRNWLRTNGFCEAFGDGIGFEDDDFLERVKLLNIPMMPKDDLLVRHIEHSRDYLDERRDFYIRNKDLYNFIWDKNRTV